MPHSRQFVAIMFTDIVGFTALIDEDEQEAYQVLKKTKSLNKL